MSSVDTVDIATVTAPIPVLETRPRLRDTFAALRAHNYRLYIVSQLFANTGGWMARIAVDWLVLELTGNVALVGLTVTLQFAPTLLLGPWAGVLSDRVDRRRVLLITQSVGALANGTLAALVLLGWVQVWQVFLVAAVTGASMAIDGPSRSAFVSEMVGTRRLRNAIALNASIFHLGGLLGPAISGVLIVLIGSGWSIAVNAVTSVVAIVALAVMRRRELIPSPRVSAQRGQIREALRYIHGKPTIFWPLVLLGFNALFGMSLPVLLTASAGDTYGTGAAGYGLYSSLAAVGAMVGSFLSTLRRELRLRSLVFTVIAYGLITAFAGFAPWYPLFLGALVGIGLSRITFGAAAESLTQLSTNMAIRGRVMSIYIMVMVGGQAVGGVVMGWIAEHLGTTVAFAVAGLVPATAGVVVAIVLARRHQLRIRFSLRSPRRFVRIVGANRS
ncbi:MAG TPA: MFS transporter [Pseudolysinimonas sp.]|nr:MFS transporter [Pseudolysinimonas sp.]